MQPYTTSLGKAYETSLEKTDVLSPGISDVWGVVLDIILPLQSRRKETKKLSPAINLLVKSYEVLCNVEHKLRYS